jgi:hypothetical protein
VRDAPDAASRDAGNHDLVAVDRASAELTADIAVNPALVDRGARRVGFSDPDRI